MDRAELITDDYLQQNVKLHSKKGFGGSGWKYLDDVLRFASEVGAVSILDYGCGENTLGKALRKAGYKAKLRSYDPAIKKYERMPEPVSLVVCTDVLEHIEPSKLDKVLQHIFELAEKGIYLAIATRPANKLLPDGRNAHQIIEGAEWWEKRIKRKSWEITKVQERRKGSGLPHDVRLWLKRLS